jgi:hypothetical protein
MKILWWKKEYQGCEFQDCCNCKIKDKLNSCEDCKWYLEIDSGYGYCKALPIPVVVGWCKDICSLFKVKANKS